MSRTGGRRGWPKITCLIDTRKTRAHTCKNTHEDTKIKSFSESGWEMGKGTECALVKRPAGRSAEVLSEVSWRKARRKRDFLGDDFWRPVRKEKVEQTLGTWEFMAISCQHWEHP